MKHQDEPRLTLPGWLAPSVVIACTLLFSPSAATAEQGGLPARIAALEAALATLQAANAQQASQLSALQAALANETGARQAADTALQNNVNAESAAREAADDALQSRAAALENKTEFLSVVDGTGSVEGDLTIHGNLTTQILTITGNP
jgi:hypothetical protein